MAWVMLNITEKFSKINHNPYYKIEWYDVELNKLATTSIDPAYRNWRNWHHLISQPVFGIYTGLRYATKGKQIKVDNNDNLVVNADFLPFLEHKFNTQNEAIEFVEDYINKGI